MTLGSPLDKIVLLPLLFSSLTTCLQHLVEFTEDADKLLVVGCERRRESLSEGDDEPSQPSFGHLRPGVHNVTCELRRVCGGASIRTREKIVVVGGEIGCAKCRIVLLIREELSHRRNGNGHLQNGHKPSFSIRGLFKPRL